jgi:hypothetical protein
MTVSQVLHHSDHCCKTAAQFQHLHVLELGDLANLMITVRHILQRHRTEGSMQPCNRNQANAPEQRASPPTQTSRTEPLNAHTSRSRQHAKDKQCQHCYKLAIHARSTRLPTAAVSTACCRRTASCSIEKCPVCMLDVVWILTLSS